MRFAKRWWWRLDPLYSVENKLDDLLDVVCRVQRFVWRVKMGQQEILAKVAEMNVAISNVAADIARLSDKITTSMSPEQVAEVQAAITTTADALNAVAAIVPEPEAPPA